MAPPLTTGSDRTAAMPDSLTARQDHIARAVRSLREEGRRLERLGLESPLARCHQEKRYWNFLSGLFALPGADETSLHRGVR